MKNNYLLSFGTVILLCMCWSCTDSKQTAKVNEQESISVGEVLFQKAQSGKQQLDDGST